MEEVLGDPPTRGDLLRAGGSFAGTVAMAVYFAWKAQDLAWGLWASSLSLGYLTIIVALALEARRRGAAEGRRAGFIVSLVLFTIHFGGFHFGFCVFLDEHLPLEGEKGTQPGIFAAVFKAFAWYWPLIAVTMLHRFGDFLRLRTQGGRREGVIRSYVNVVRLWSMIACLIVLDEFGVRWLAIGPVLAGCYFPWGMVFRHVMQRRLEARLRRIDALEADRIGREQAGRRPS
jgi:hypothetical protein